MRGVMIVGQIGTNNKYSSSSAPLGHLVIKLCSVLARAKKKSGMMFANAPIVVLTPSAHSASDAGFEWPLLQGGISGR
jgi:hypothetical protein